MPEALVLLAVLIFLRWGEGLQQQAASSIRLYPYAVVVVGAMLCIRFHQSRMLLALVLLALADRSLTAFSAADLGMTVAGRSTFQAVATLLPLNLVALALLPERDTLSPEGITRVTIVAIQVVLVLLLRDHIPEALLGFVESGFSSNGMLGWTTLGLPAVLTFIGGFAILLGLLLAKTNAIYRGYFWALIAVFMALSSDFNEFTPTFLFATTGLIMIVAVIEASYSMAYNDGLTGLPSRRALSQAMMRLGGTYTIAMVDVDHFKKFNDDYGHDVGDQVLRKVAGQINRVGGGGKAFRYGGEEFAVLFPRKKKTEILGQLERLRLRIGNSAFTLRAADRPIRKPKHPVSPHDPRRLSITVSIGAAQLADHYDSPDDVISRADEALYAAKESGRNRVKLHED